MRIGFGSDLHRLVAGTELILGGIKFESDVSPVGHSDGDALLHAITDAILGALAEGDIGSHFPPSDDQWKDCASSVFVEKAVQLMKERGYGISNVDTVVHLERPKLRPHINSMRANIANLLGIDISRVSVKAKTGEGVDAIGERRAIKAEACLILIEI